MAIPPRVDRTFQGLGINARNALGLVFQMLHGGLVLHDNCKPTLYTAAFGAGYVANASQAFDISGLGLAWAPAHAIITDKDTQGSDAYWTAADKTAWTATSITIRSPLAGAQNIMLWLF